MNYNAEKSNLLNIQQIATLGFIIALFLSYLLTLDDKLKLEGKSPLFDNKTAQNIEVIQSILLVIVSLTFLYVSYRQYKIAKLTNDEDSAFNLFLKTDTSVLSVISALIGIYIIYKNYNGNLSIAETLNV